MKKIIAVTIVTLSLFSLNAQTTAPAFPYLRTEFVIIGGPAYTLINDESVKEDVMKDQQGKIGYTAGFALNKFIKKRISVSLGLMFVNHKTRTLQKGMLESIEQRVDKDGYLYYLVIDSDIEEKTSISSLEIPLMLNFHLGKPGKVNGFFGVGIVNGFWGGGKKVSKGAYETMGKYLTQYQDQYILVERFPTYGYQVNTVDKTEENYYKGYNVSLRLTCGFSAALSQKCVLQIAPVYTIGLKDITKKDRKDAGYENALGGKSAYGKTKTSSIGLNICIGININ